MLPILGPILGIVSKFIPDSNKQAELAAQLEKELTKQMELQSNIIRSEQNLGGLAALWRPLCMITFLVMITTHWLLYDVFMWANVTFNWNLYTPQDPGFTDGLLEVIKLGLGGYIAGRSVEKGLALWKK